MPKVLQAPLMNRINCAETINRFNRIKYDPTTEQFQAMYRYSEIILQKN